MMIKRDINKILLIAPPWYRIWGGNSSRCPLGLCHIAGVLEESGFDVVVYNADFRGGVSNERGINYEEYEEYLRVINNMNHSLWKEVKCVISEQSPDLVGISVMTPKYKSALNVANIVKNINPEIPVVFGGIHPTVLPEATLANKNVDIVVRGEGEYTLLDIIKNIAELHKVLGISYKQDSKVIHNPDRPLIQDLDKLPIPARHLLLRKENYSPEDFGNIFASRGCPYQCIFCASHKIWSRKVRYRSPENVINEIKHIQKSFKTKQFRFEDDAFTINKKFTIGICNLLIKEKLDIRWQCETRANLITRDLVTKMRRAGCEHVVIGVESGDEKTLKKLKKGITVEQIINAKNILRQIGMSWGAFFMIGFPWETKNEIDRTVSFMKELNPDVAFINTPTPYPGTELYHIYESEGILPQNLDWSTFFHHSPDMFLAKHFTKEEFIQIIDKARQIFDKHNRIKKEKLLLSKPLYILKRAIEGNYGLHDLLRLFRRYIMNS